MKIKNYKEGDLRIWWIPQVPMSTIFYVSVKNIEQAILVDDTLARYDTFQFENNIKPDYSNAGGLEIFENGEWCEWCNESGMDLSEVKEELEEI